MDGTDVQILRLLAQNGRLTRESVAGQVHLSRPAVHERIRRMEEAGVITGYHAAIDWSRVGASITAFIWVRTSGGKLQDIAEEVMALTTSDALVEECHLVTGEWCLLLKAHCCSMQSLQDLIHRLREITRIRNTMTTLILSSGQNPSGMEQGVVPTEAHAVRNGAEAKR